MILVTGAAGIIGRHVVHELTDAGVDTRALVHSAAAVATEQFARALIVSGEIADRDVLERALRDVRVLVVLSPAHPDQVSLERHLIAAAQRHGVQRVIKLSSAGTSAHAAFRVGRWHWQTERLLASTTLDWVIVRSQRPMQHLYTQLGSVLGQHAYYGCQGDHGSGDVHVRDVAAVLAAVARDDAHRHATLEVTGPEAITPRECARMLGVHMGQPVEYVDCTPADFVRGQMAGGIARWQAEDRAAWQSAASAGAFATPTTTVAQVTGRRPRDFNAFASEFAASVRYTRPPASRVQAGAGVGTQAAPT